VIPGGPSFGTALLSCIRVDNEGIDMTHDELAFPIYRVKIEDGHLEPVGNYDVYDTHRQAMAAFYACVAAPDPGLGSVYVTVDDGDNERVIAAHRFV